jgi:predicted acylesterase/phospholipase RssA
MSPDNGKSESPASTQGEARAQSETRAPSAPDHASVAVAVAAIEAIKKWAATDPDAQVAAIAAIEEMREKAPGAASVAIEAIREIAERAPSTRGYGHGPKRAICLGGGGPAVGLHLGALQGLKDCGVDFGNERSIWATSCIGAWVGVIYNQAAKGREISETVDFFHEVFRGDASFESFPTNTVFAPDWAGYAEAAGNYLFDLKHYKNAILPREILDSFLYTMSSLGDRKNWKKFSEADFNRWTLNHVLAVNPVVRFWTGLLYKSTIDGRTRLHYKDSKILRDIKFDELDKRGKPYIFHNAFNFKKEDIDLFANHNPKWGHNHYEAISAASLCACSALPFVEQTVQVGGDVYCEGALVDTVNFKNLLAEHNPQSDPLEEIWINRIVDARQIHKPRNLHDALANLCQLFAATVGEDDVKLFKYHVRENNSSTKQELTNLKFTGTIIEIEVDDQINFHWSHKNLADGQSNGAKAAANAYKLYKKYKDLKKPDVTMIPDDLTDDQILAAGVPLSPRRARLREARLRAAAR